ncbi:MAG: type I glyceraldehyde-3-phosphate dehydrogenase [Bacillota bacterium]|jgi:glyceraldehyde 3-phosphate dehydrogenase
MTVRVGINGFGRIGRQVLRIAHEREGIEVVAINDPKTPEVMAHMFRYDSAYGRFNGSVEATKEGLIVNGKLARVSNARVASETPWGEYGADIIVDGTGLYKERKDAVGHLEAGAKKVILAYPGKDEDVTLVMGVNHEDYDPSKHHIVSNASCTTNCLAPVAKVLNDEFGIVRGMMTTVHSYTNDQRLLDKTHKDPRRARAAAVSMIPTTTGAAKAIGLVIPELQGKMNGFAMRVPTPSVSVVDLVVELGQNVTAEQVNDALRRAAAGPLVGILAVSDEPLVSVDYVGDPHSSIVDSELTMVMGGNLVKVIAWYDNEWGYSCRCIDMCEYFAQRGL